MFARGIDVLRRQFVSHDIYKGGTQFQAAPKICGRLHKAYCLIDKDKFCRRYDGAISVCLTCDDGYFDDAFPQRTWAAFWVARSLRSKERPFYRRSDSGAPVEASVPTKALGALKPFVF
jgi:hypothetical protein